MSDDKIEEIRARHSRDDRWRNTLPQMHEDRATLLAEVDRLRAENERLRAEIDTATRERDEARAEVTRMQELLRGISINMVDLIEQLTRERDAARAENDRLRAENERLREALVLGSEVLASHQGSPQREWHSGGAWLYPGDSINVVRAPLPEIKVEP